MNRFLTRKKDKKKAQPEPKQELNIATALPAVDDFRTSLIMPGLSTRFSMLREQDDPSSKLGKASDDSVLHPKRQSRLHEFGFVPGGLSDIAEVSSINGSIRPPFATQRQNSFDSHATDDGASVMSRARPGEGNIMFGGRQKVFKISGSGSTQGRLLYDDDVHSSTFQRMRQQEKDRLAAMEAREKALQEPLSPTRDTYSPTVEAFGRRRETSSSTNTDSNARTSTAATSIASQGAAAVSAAPTSPTELNRSTTKTRRLYDQGLDQQMYEQQSSAMNRLNSFQRTRAPTGRNTPPMLFSQTRSATSLNDRFARSGSLRTGSPTSLHHPGIQNGKDTPSNGSSPILSRAQSPPPMSPLTIDSEEAQTLNTALQYQDRGKATAMGAFNKPKQAFSEEQYAERTMRMQQERQGPVSRPDNPRKPSLRERAELEKRKRAGTGGLEHQRSAPSSEHKQGPSAFSVFQAAANHIKHSPATAQNQPEPAPKSVQSPDSRKEATFFASPGSSDDEEDVQRSTIAASFERGRRDNLPTATGPAPPILEHPALRSRSNSRPAERPEHPTLRSRSNSRPDESEPRSSPGTNSTSILEDPDVDSPTLGPANGGLSGMIRQHLRNVSNVSSDYGDNRQSVVSPPALQTQNFASQRRQPASETDTPALSTYSHSNPWDLDDIDSNPFYNERGSMSSVSPVEAPRPKAMPTNGLIMPHNELQPGDREDEKSHQRGRSTEEHEAFQRDLAQRQRAIQQSLRAKAEGRSTSPAPAPASGLKSALNMLRAKSSRESFATVESHKQQEAPSKAMKMLGMTGNGSIASLASDHWKQDSLRQKPVRVLQQSERDAQREMGDTRQRSATGDSARDVRPKGRSPPTSAASSTRDRSSSEVSSGRSRSRSGRYRDDLEQAMAEGISSKSAMYSSHPSPPMPGYANASQPFPTEQASQASQGRMRSRSNSRTAAASYFESKHLQPIHTGPGSSPRLSPSGASPHPLQFSPGLPVSPRPSPGGPSPGPNAFRPHASPVPPFSANNTPPVSNPGTPVAATFNPNAAPQHMAKPGNLRKKSIVKTDISEPMFISTTSVIDTIKLPAGVSLRNGNDAGAPPLPPINPMRRRFGLGAKSEYHDPAVHSGLGAPHAPFADAMRTNSSDALSSQTALPRQHLRKTLSEGKSLHGTAQAQMASSPAMPQTPYGRNDSPPRPINQQHFAQTNMDGAMF